MKLVEVISGLKTHPDAARDCLELMASWGKRAVTAKDVPGFIVNRVARPFYAEGWQAYEEGVADAVTIDFLFRDLAGFRMGPLELGDLIGHDVNSKAAKSVYQSYFGRTRFRPSLMQGQLAESGLLGHKSGQGIYDHSENAVTPEVTFEKGAKATHIISGPDTTHLPDISGNGGISSSLPRGFWSVDEVIVGFTNGVSASAMSNIVSCPAAVLDTVRDFEQAKSLAYSASNEKAARAARGLISAFDKKPIQIADRAGALVFRTMLQLVNASADALRDKVASAKDIDTALQFGVNYPFGPMAWAQEFGLKKVISSLENIARETGEPDMYQPNEILRRMAGSSDV
jgi:3-hydroxybutyryl-CoA dehydrogenase